MRKMHIYKPKQYLITMNKRLLLSVLGLVFCLFAMAQLVTPEVGKYYKIVNQNPDKAVSAEGVTHGFVIQENKVSHGLNAVEPGSSSAYQQIWYCAKTGQFKNALTQRYIGTASRSVQVQTVTNATTLTMTAVNTANAEHFLLTNGMQLHADGSNVVVGWNDEGNKSNWWRFEEVTDIDASDLAQAQADYNTEQAQKAALEAIVAKENVYAPIVQGYFSDGACTVLKSTYSSKTDEQMKSIMTSDGLPEQVQTIVLRIKNKWSDELNPAISEQFRVAEYKCYTRQWIKNQVKSTQLGDQNNPTGIWMNSLQLMYVFVEGDIPSGTQLNIVGGSGAEIDRQYWNGGTQLHSGMNIIYNGNENSYMWIMYTAEGDLTKNISRFPALKIHIEGGDVLGYADVAGKNEADANSEYEKTLKHANAMMNARGVSTKKMNFAVKGERGLFLFPVDCYNQIWSSSTKWGYKIYKSMKFYDDVLKWEWSAMGWQDRVEAGEATGRECLDPGYGDAYYPSKINNLAAAMMLYNGSNPYSSDNYTCMPSVGGVESSYNAERQDFDTWCVGHESGHNNQSTINLPSSMESSNNYFSNIITYQWGYRMSRGMNFDENLQYWKTKTMFPQRSISMTLRMWYNLYLYYHLAGHNKGFTQKLHKLLRQSPLMFGGDGWYEGGGSDGNGGANMGQAANSWLKFYEKACEAAGEDLTEFFRLWGFFYTSQEAQYATQNPNNGKWYVYCGDYTSYYVESTQAMIDAAIARVKKKGYPENKQIMFIEDRLEAQERYDINATSGAIKPDNGGTVRTTEWLKNYHGDIGFFKYYQDGKMKLAKAEDYTYMITGGEVKIKVKSGCENNGVGIIVYKEDGTIGWLSNRFNFTMPAEVAAGNYKVVIINADGSEVEIMNALDSDDPDVLKDVLTNAVNASKTYTNMSSNAKVGWYTTSAVANLKSLVTQANNALSASDSEQYKTLTLQINAEMVDVESNGEKTQLENAGIYYLQNFERGHYLTTNYSCNETKAAAANRWVLIPVKNEPGYYYLQNNSTKKYVNFYDGYTYNAATQQDATKFHMEDYGQGAFCFAFRNNKDKTMYINETPTWNGTISWSWASGSAWVIERYSYLDPYVEAELMSKLIEDEKALVDRVAIYDATPHPIELQVTDQASAGYLSCNLEAQPHSKPDFYNMGKLIDNTRTTYFFSVKPDEGVTPALTVDLGEGNTLKSFTLKLVSATTNKPAKIVVRRSTNGTTWSTVKTFTGQFSGTTRDFEQSVSTATASRYFKFEFSELQNEASGYEGALRLADFGMYTTDVVNEMREEYKDVMSGTTPGTTLVANCKKYEATCEEALKGDPSPLSFLTPYKNLLNAYNRLAEAIGWQDFDPTGILNLEENGNEDAETEGVAYDLTGRKVTTNAKGIVIINGRKVVR